MWELAHDVAPIVNAELKACVAAGADFVQIDDPSLRNVLGRGARDGGAGQPQVVDGVKAKIALHICFGTNRGRPRAFNRTYRPLFPALLEAHVDQFIFEFTNRQMAEIDLWQQYQPRQELVVGVVDQKCYTDRDAGVRGGAHPHGAAVRARREAVDQPGLRVQPDAVLDCDGKAARDGRRARRSCGAS